jgi:CDP-diacylglycerol---serine O-phosphatidyltransferase
MRIALPPPDGSRDPRIDDPSNIWIVHPIGRMLLRPALRLGLAANTVTIVGLLLGASAAGAYWRWPDWRWATLGFLLSIAWLVADGLDGMIARASGTASDFGRLLDGLCDHLVFALLYVSLAASLETAEAWLLAVAAGAAHAVQSSLYEGERLRFQRRVRGEPPPPAVAPSANLLVRAYDAVAGSRERSAQAYDLAIAAAPDTVEMRRSYARQARRPLATMAILSNNSRVLLIYAACLVGRPDLFWWIELTLLAALLACGIAWLGIIERRHSRPNRSAESPAD